MNPEAQTKRLPVFKTIRDSFLFPWERKKRFLRAHSIHILVFSILLALILYFSNLKNNIEGDDSTLVLSLSSDSTLIFSISIAALITGFGFYILFVITCHRLVLMEESAVPRNGMIKWTKREGGFFLWLIAFGLFYMFLGFFEMVYALAFSSFVMGILDEFFNYKSEINLIPYAGLLILPAFLYMTARVCPIFPATAIDKKVNMTWAWNLSEGNGWRLALVLGVAPLILELIVKGIDSFSEISSIPYIGLIVYLPALYFLTVIEIVALSLSYKHLVEFNVPEPSEVE